MTPLLNESVSEIQKMTGCEAVGMRILDGTLIWDTTVRKTAELKLRNAYSEIKRLKNQLKADQSYLREEIKPGRSSYTPTTARLKFSGI